MIVGVWDGDLFWFGVSLVGEEGVVGAGTWGGDGDLRFDVEVDDDID